MDVLFPMELALEAVEAARSGHACIGCGQKAELAISEVWGHDFMLETCCEAMHEASVLALQEGASEAALLLRELGAEELLGLRLRGVSDLGLSLGLDFVLRLAPVAWARAREFVRHHHEHCRPPAGWRWGIGCFNGGTLVGVAMVGRPVARLINPAEVVEVNRLCLDRSLPDPIRRNAASMLYGHAAREARRRGYHRIITYTLAAESGVSLTAAGWTRDGASRGGTWSRPSRQRGDSGPTEPKIRWSRTLTR